MNSDPAYLVRSKAPISIVGAVIGLNGDRLVAGPWLVLSFDHPLSIGDLCENRSQSGCGRV
jgi:hypothetical protein